MEPEQLAIEAEGLTRRFGTVTALAGVSFSIRKGEFFSLLGPSGCGKTTLLRLIAGLDLPDEGRLQISGRNVAEIPAHKRPVNTVFQSYALFPHMTIRENVAFGLRMKKVPPNQITERTDRVMELVQISDLAERRPAQISGGQKQRVALARALVNEPEVLLLDEPLGALDLKLRKELQVELHALQRRLGITFVYVTHDQDEALAMSDRIAVINAGRIEQMDEAKILYERPRTRFVAQFLGSCNLIEGEVELVGEGMLKVRTGVGLLDVRSPLTPSLSPNGGEGVRRTGEGVREKITLAIRPEKVLFAERTTAVLTNRLTVRIADIVYRGAETHYRLDAGGCTLSAIALNIQPTSQRLQIGDSVPCFLPENALVVLED
jgi:spermidine/putrescine transport system ATP-binding protein